MFFKKRGMSFATDYTDLHGLGIYTDYYQLVYGRFQEETAEVTK